MEDDGGGVDDGDIDRGEVTFVGEDKGDAGELADESGDSAADPEDEGAGVVGDVRGRPWPVIAWRRPFSWCAVSA